MTKVKKSASGGKSKKAAAPRAKVTASGKPRTAQIRMPTDREWKDLIDALNLNSRQADKLRTAISWAIEDAGLYRLERQPPKREVKVQLAAMEKAFERLRHECTTRPDLLEFSLPGNVDTFLGRSMTFTAIGRAVGRDVFPEPSSKLSSATQADEPLSWQFLEERSNLARCLLGLNHGPEIFKHIVEQIHFELKQAVDRSRSDVGGKPPNRPRQLLIEALVWASPAVLGKKASVAKSGDFVNLCSEVFPVCGLSARGLASAIPDAVREALDGGATWVPDEDL